jgi:hypothetical protein
VASKCTWGADLLVYYREGDPKSVVVPDNFVTLGVDPGLRRIYQTWKEGRVPDWVLEITSSTTRKVDQQDKNRLYAQLGIAEYFLFDPLGDELQPALQGYRRSRGVYQPIVPETDGALAACSIGIKLQLSGTDLVLCDLATGDVLLTEAEAERLHAEAVRAAAEAVRLEAEAARLEAEAARLEADRERMARLAAEARVAALEAKLRHESS